MANTKARIQKFGNSMSAMVMPNIGAFIAWGLLAALFIPTGYFPNEKLNTLVGPTLTYILPTLIGYTAGSNIYGRRGGVAGAISTVGVIVGSDVTMLVGGMIMGPLGAVVIRKFDRMVEGKIRPGLEMLVDNFSMGIIGAIMMVFGLYAVAPIYGAINAFLMAAVTWAQTQGVLQLSNIFVVPAQLLFLNNAVNHGIFSPLGLQQAAETGKSVLFLIEANGGPWTGLVLAFAVFGTGMAKKSAPGAVIIQCIGGIGEVSYPYALTKPITMLGPICGHIVSNFWFSLLGGGTVAMVSPGSLPALIMMSPKGTLLVNVSGYIVGGIISFLVVGFLLKRSNSGKEEIEDSDASSAAKPAQSAAAANIPAVTGGRKVEKVYFCCDAGMGSSVMASSILTTQLSKAGMSIKVSHASLSEVPADADVVVVSAALYDRALSQVKDGVPILKVNDLMSKSEHAAVAKAIKEMAE